MDPAAKLCTETWSECSLRIGAQSSKNCTPSNHVYSQQHHRKREDSYSPDFIPPLSKFCKSSEPSCDSAIHLKQRIPEGDGKATEIPAVSAATGQLNDWDPRSVLSNLCFLEQKIHQLQDLVNLISGQDKRAADLSSEFMAHQRQLVTADLTSIIVQLISTAGNLLPSVKNSHLVNPVLGQLQSMSGAGFPPNLGVNNINASETLNSSNGRNIAQSHLEIEQMSGWELEQNYTGKNGLPISNIEEHVAKDEEDPGEGENLPPGSYEVLQLEKEEILAPHTHFCLICGKGFKRDANLRMHMRGHGDEYKTPAALAKPSKEPGSEPMLMKRYSCPYAGCKRNKDHKKFQPLKTILCVKNHYKRTHCDKSYTCSRCNNKKFSVLADLKTHEKHCGRDKWLCSCGTTFSRKDKLFGHVALFQGHTPALPAEETKGGSWGTSNGGESNEAPKAGDVGFNFSSSFSSSADDIRDVKGGIDDPTNFFSSLDFDTCNYGEPFDMSESSLTCLLSEPSQYLQKNGEDEMDPDLFR